MEHIANDTEYLIFKTPTPRFLVVNAGQHLSTPHEYTIYSDKGAAVEAMQELVPEFFIEEPEPPYVPEVITPRQARLALLGAGMLDSVTTALAALPEPSRSAAQVEWDYALEVRRNDPWVVAVGDSLGLTHGQIDDLFIQAAKL